MSEAAATTGFSEASTIREVLRHPRGRELLYQHGYDVGEGFVDFASQHQSLLAAARGGRLRDVAGLLSELNRGALAKTGRKATKN